MVSTVDSVLYGGQVDSVAVRLPRLQPRPLWDDDEAVGGDIGMKSAQTSTMWDGETSKISPHKR